MSEKKHEAKHEDHGGDHAPKHKSPGGGGNAAEHKSHGPGIKGPSFIEMAGIGLAGYGVAAAAIEYLPQATRMVHSLGVSLWHAIQTVMHLVI